jgi:transmembrane sensor
MPDAGAREIMLEGEAVFDVAHDSTRPFVVYAGNAVARDIGTRFDVRAYPGAGAVQVVVASGIVMLSDTAHARTPGVLLTAGQLGAIDSAGRATHQPNVDTAQFFAWTDGRLAFRNTPLREAAARLERWFDLDIEIPDSTIATRRITATISAQPVQDVLDAITLPLHLRYERHGRRVVIHRPARADDVH